MKPLSTILLVGGISVGVVAVAGLIVVYSGAYNVAADDPHTRPVYAILEAARERSIAARAARLQIPGDLADPARIRQGAGNYAAMCTGCHLSPGAEPTELSKGLYPSPPDLTRETVSPAEAFWVIKHGIKASGMPAWGKSMQDDYIWNMAAFLQQLPKLDQAQYAALVAGSGGHSHGGGETGGHSHTDGQDHHGDAGGDRHSDGSGADGTDTMLDHGSSSDADLSSRADQAGGTGAPRAQDGDLNKPASEAKSASIETAATEKHRTQPKRTDPAGEGQNHQH